MSFLADIDQSTSRAKSRSRHNSILNTPLSSIHELDVSSEFRVPPDPNNASTWPATISTHHQPSEGSEITVLGELYDSGTFDNASSVTLQDEFSWHEISVNKHPQPIPSMILPNLLQGINDLSPLRSSLEEVEGDTHEVDASKDVVPQYSAAQKGKWKARRDDDFVYGNRWVRSPSPQLHLDGIRDPVKSWVVHNRPVLQDYADRQMMLPLGRRLQVSIGEPSQFILGAIQFLVNRDQRDSAEHSRQLGPQLMENFVDIDCWAREYFRSRHGTQVVDSDVSTLLAIVMNNFYEGQVQLIDRLVEFALEKMRFYGRRNLAIEDFAFGFDFKMSQDLPFYVETSSRIREPLPIRAVEMRPAPGPVTTHSGRQVKPTKRAQAAAERTQTNASQRRNKGKNTSQVIDIQAPNSSSPAARQRRSAAQPISDSGGSATPLPPQAEPCTATPVLHKLTSKGTSSTRPSNLGLPSVFPGSSSTVRNGPLGSNDRSKSKASTSPSVDGAKVASSSISSVAVRSPPRLKIVIPKMRLPASTVAATSESGSTPRDKVGSTDVLGSTKGERGARFRGPRDERGGGRGRSERGGDRLRAEITDVTPDNDSALPTARSVGADNAEVSATVNPSVAHPTLADTSGATCGARSYCADAGIASCDEGRSTSQYMHTSEPFPPPNDPSHPQGMKRKLDDCQD